MNKNCVTHHYACDCRENMMKIVCERLLNEHDELKKFQAGFTKPIECMCSGCQNARKLLGKVKK